MDKKIKILVVDDSAIIRQTLKTVFSEHEQFEVIALASDPYIAVQKMKTLKPDVITLDVQMPRMDGLTFLKKIMNQHPIPVVIISSLTAKQSHTAIEAYRLGATEVIEKPSLSSELLFDEWREKLVRAIKTASKSKISANLKKQGSVFPLVKPANAENKVAKHTCDSFILIGSSAGGTEVIANILNNLSSNTPPVLIAQHMPAMFTASYAERLNNISQLKVKEAAPGDLLERGNAYIAPGDEHMKINNNGFNYFIELSNSEKVNRHRPSVDVLFESALKFKGIRIMAIVLSGMGKDGAVGMLNLKKSGAITIAQDEETSIVYGMPREAVRIGAANHSMSVKDIIKAIHEFSS